MTASGSRKSNNERSFLIDSFLCPYMFYPMFPIRAQEIKTQTVFFPIDFIYQPLPQFCPLGRFDDAFENRKLHPLSVILACLGNAAQTLLTAKAARRYIITDQNKHFSYFQRKGG